MQTIAGRILLGIKNEPPIQRACNPRFKSNAFYPVKTLMLMRGRGWARDADHLQTVRTLRTSSPVERRRAEL